MVRLLPPSRSTGFTLVEMLVVMVIIAILAGLILSGAGYAQKAAARKRAASEIAAMEAAAEGYKADNGIYPRGFSSDGLDPKVTGSPTSYKAASLDLYKALSGDENPLDRKVDTGKKQYMEFNPSMLEPSGGAGAVTAIIDPFGNSYGYSTKYTADSEKTPPSTNPGGYNPTFDLWSTSGKAGTPANDGPQWITNW